MLGVGVDRHMVCHYLLWLGNQESGNPIVGSDLTICTVEFSLILKTKVLSLNFYQITKWKFLIYNVLNKLRSFRTHDSSFVLIRTRQMCIHTEWPTQTINALKNDEICKCVRPADANATYLYTVKMGDLSEWSLGTSVES